MHSVIGSILLITLLFTLSYAQVCENTLPQCDDATCGVNLNVRFDNTTSICDCQDDDYDVHFTECANGKKSAFFYYKPPAVCLNGNLPAPVIDLDCSMVCTGGNYYSTNSSTCVSCPAGAYSNTEKLVTYNHWTSIPPQFSTSCDTSSSATCSPWTVRGDWIDSGFNRFVNNLRSTLEYRFEVKSEYSTLSFAYQVNSEPNWDYLTVYLDNQVLLKESVKTEIKQVNVSYGYHTVKWVYSKDPSLSGGEDIAKVGFITLRSPNNIAFNCDQCKPGEYSDGTIPCTKCSPGTYSDSYGASKCQECPSYYTSYSGATKCFSANTPCTEDDYFSNPAACDASGNQQVTYQWVLPKICNESNPDSVQLPSTTTRACVNPQCKPGQQSDNAGGCTYCPTGMFSANGDACQQCDTGSASSAKHLVYDDWTQWPSPAWNNSCIGDCISNGWRLLGDHIDTGNGNGESYNILFFPVNLVQDRNLPIRQRSVAIEYALSCTEGSIQFAIDGSLIRSFPCTGCNDLTNYQTFTIPWLNPGYHRFSAVFHSVRSDVNDTMICNKAVIRTITVSGNALEGGAASCQNCPTGTFTVSQDKCENCPAGSSSGVKSTECKLCDANTFAPEHSSQCYPCGNGFSSQPGSAKCEWNSGTCKFGFQDNGNRTVTFQSQDWDGTTFASLDEPGTLFYLNLCGNKTECNEIGAQVCKYIPSSDDWVNLGGDLDISPTQSQNVLAMNIVATDYTANCPLTNETNSPRVPINTTIIMLCDEDAVESARATVSVLGPCSYQYIVSTRSACPACTEQDYTTVQGACDPDTHTAPVRYIRNSTLTNAGLSGKGYCAGGVDKTNLVEYVPCSIPLPVPYWIPLTVVAIFIGLLVSAAVIIAVLFKKFRDIRRKYDQFVDEDDNGVPRPKGMEMQTPAGINISAD